MVGAVWLVLVGVTAMWLAIDRHPPEWDYANHLERAVLCWRGLVTGDVAAVLGRSSFYPPLVPCLAGLLFRVMPSDAAFGQIVILAFLGLAMAATYVLARRWASGGGAVVAAVLVGTAPLVVQLTLRFQLDVPLMAMVVVALETSDLMPRIRDGMLLCTARTRKKTLSGDEWCHTYQYQWAESAGSAHSTLVVNRAGAVVSAEQVGEGAPLITQPIEWEG